MINCRGVFFPNTNRTLRLHLELKTLIWEMKAQLMKYLPLLALLVASPLVFAEEVVIGCVDCRSSMSLVDPIFRELFPGKTPKWIFIQAQTDYSRADYRQLDAFPSERVLMKLKLRPLEGGISDQEAAKILRANGVQYVLPGTDSGANRTPNLNRILGFQDNSPETAPLRLQKGEGVKVAGEYAIPTHKLKSVEAALKWIDAIKAQGYDEIFVKPDVGLFGINAQSVKISDRASLKRNLSELLGSGDTFLIQPKIVGRKFFSNTYTSEGVTRVVSAAEYFQIENKGKPNYFVDGMLSLESAEVKGMQKAADFLMPAYGIEIGMGHPEFILCEKTGRLYLLEMNGRVGGSGLPALDRAVYGINQIQLHLLRLFDRARFEKEFSAFPRPRLRSGFLMLLSSPGEGVWNAKALSEIQAHPSYLLAGPQYEIFPGTRVKHTTSMEKAEGPFFFVGTRDQVRDGILRVVDLYESGALIDHTRVINDGGVTKTLICPDLLVDGRRTEFTQAKRNALSTIDWRKF